MIRAALLSASLWLIAQPAFSATSALQAVKETAGGIIAALNDAKLQGNRSARHEQIKALVRERFDFEEMAKRSVGPAWSRQSPADQQQFIAAFTELLMDVYIDRIDEQRTVQISYEGEQRDGNFATVNTKVQDKQGKPLRINYRLQPSGSDWKVYDVVIEDVSIVNNYRSQFSRLLSKGNFSDLLQRLSSKQIQSPGAS